jgi:hypothetical protein
MYRDWLWQAKQNTFVHTSASLSESLVTFMQLRIIWCASRDSFSWLLWARTFYRTCTTVIKSKPPIFSFRYYLKPIYTKSSMSLLLITIIRKVFSPSKALDIVSDRLVMFLLCRVSQHRKQKTTKRKKTKIQSTEILVMRERFDLRTLIDRIAVMFKRTWMT